MKCLCLKKCTSVTGFLKPEVKYCLNISYFILLLFPYRMIETQSWMHAVIFYRLFFFQSLLEKRLNIITYIVSRYEIVPDVICNWVHIVQSYFLSLLKDGEQSYFPVLSNPMWVCLGKRSEGWINMIDISILEPNQMQKKTENDNKKAICIYWSIYSLGKIWKLNHSGATCLLWLFIFSSSFPDLGVCLTLMCIK